MTVREILQNAGFTILHDGPDFIRVRPLHRDGRDNNSLSVSKRNGGYRDFVTGETGTLAQLIKRSTGGTVENIDSESENELKEDLKKAMREITPLFPSYSFYTKKGISPKTLELFQSGFCQWDKMYNRFVFPIYNPDNSLVGYSGRRVDNKPGVPKWKNIGEKRKWVYPFLWNKKHINSAREIILVESIGNMLALWEAGIKNSLICFGTSLSKDLLATIIAANPNRIILGFDNDAGSNPGQSASAKIKAELEKWFDKSKICSKVPPVGLDLSDLFSSGGKDAILNWYSK